MFTRSTAFAAASLLCLALPAVAEGLSGRYAVAGMNPDGSKYTGTVDLVENGGAVSMTWQVAGSNYAGAGPVDGKVITIRWGDPEPVYYVITPTGELHGTWAGGTALEKLTPLP
ncbi:hypothetical protein FHY55_18825 [Oceanicola sp. D3]|uniref:LIC10280 family protein n=1 Tax=Oceanicola sp. D3 TaxID=2587163 RepID=UPI001120A00E|nr:hypothetical protein [Oceanicola sp. D3]QDC11162.1 hypothetical protein FHY55_18825 [Oceanicola sp. D3]